MNTKGKNQCKDWSQLSWSDAQLVRTWSLSQCLEFFAVSAAARLDTAVAPQQRLKEAPEVQKKIPRTPKSRMKTKFNQ